MITGFPMSFATIYIRKSIPMNIGISISRIFHIMAKSSEINDKSYTNILLFNMNDFYKTCLQCKSTSHPQSVPGLILIGKTKNR